jgi:hypothetical protein
MSDTAGNNVLKRRTKASKSELEWVRKRAEKADEELDREQTNTVITIARALEDIADTEARAELDTRLTMVEEQLERLLERRDQVDQATQAELAVMRARIEDALEAMGSASESQRLAWAAMEERLSTISAQRLAVELALEGRDAEQSQDARPSRVSRKEAALQTALDDLEERARKSGRQIMDDVRATVERWHSEVAEVTLMIQDHIKKADRAQQSASKKAVTEMEAKAKALFQSLEVRAAEIEQLYGRLVEELVQERRTPDGDATTEEMPSDPDGVYGLTANDGQEEVPKDSGAAADPYSMRELISVELDQRISEAKNDLRLELFELRSSVENSLADLGELIDGSRNEYLAGIKAAEDKAARAAIHLDSLIRDLRLQVDKDRKQWSGMLRLVAGDLAQLQIRLAGAKEEPGPDG